MVLGNVIQDLQERFFDFLVSNRLIYNSSWEDPRIDRYLLDIGSDSQIVMLTGAGCNAFNYLLDDPATVHCVDANPAQNSLLEFKRVLVSKTDHPTLWHFLGKGWHPQASRVYHQTIKFHLSRQARDFWDHHINYFTRSPNEPTFYYQGTSGKVALLMRNRIKRKGLYKHVLQLLNSDTLAEQNKHFKIIEDQLWNTFYRWIMNRNMMLTMLGVPPAQRKMIEKSRKGGLISHIRHSFRQVFTKLPIYDNYFWRVYLTGSYTSDCCPNYLQEDHFEFLRSRTTRIIQHTSYLTDFLRRHPGLYTHYVLLDHQDWLAHTYPEVLKEEWKLILKNSQPGTKILFRSAGTDPSFLPPFVEGKVDFNYKAEEVRRLHQKDRVGTYGSTHLGIVR